MRPRDALAALLVLALAGCEWFSTMSDPAGYQPHEIEPIAPPPHAVPLGGLPEFDLATADRVLGTPPPARAGSVEAGGAYYATFCAVCHGADGMGKGSISDLFPAIPAIATARVAGLSDAYLFALISQGRGLMPDYGRIPAAARWDLVHYLRSMPRSGSALDATAPAAPDTSGGVTPAGGGP